MPMGPPRFPKRGQRVPKDAKWDPYKDQRGPKGSPGEAKGSPWVPKGTPRTPQGRSNDPQRVSIESPKSVPKWVPEPNPEKSTQNVHFLVAPGVKTMKNTRVWHRCPLGPKGVKIAKTHEKTWTF